jgi:hypothetical protein
MKYDSNIALEVYDAMLNSTRFDKGWDSVNIDMLEDFSTVLLRRWNDVDEYYEDRTWKKGFWEWVICITITKKEITIHYRMQKETDGFGRIETVKLCTIKTVADLKKMLYRKLGLTEHRLA